MTYMKFYSGKNVILTGATGGVGSKVAKKLIKAGKNHFKANSNRSESDHAGARSI